MAKLIELVGIKSRSLALNLILVVCFVFYLCAKRAHAQLEIINEGESKQVERIKVAKFIHEDYSEVYEITLWIILGSLIKIVLSMAHRLTEKLPESCLLVIIGLIVGATLFATQISDLKAYDLNSKTFFVFLLPPIILEAGYFMANR